MRKLAASFDLCGPLLGRFGGNRNLLQKAAAMFPAEATSLLAAIDRACEAGNLADLSGVLGEIVCDWNARSSELKGPS